MAPPGCRRAVLRAAFLGLGACLALGCRTPAAPREGGAREAGAREAGAREGVREGAEQAPGRGPAPAPGAAPAQARPAESAGAAQGQAESAEVGNGRAGLSGQGRSPLRLEPAERAAAAPSAAAHQARAERAYAVKDFELAYQEYLAAVNAAGPAGQPPAVVWLRLARIAFYENRNAEMAAYFAGFAGAGAGLEPADRELLQRLLTRLSWRQITPADIGLGDGNVSALRVDGDDLWVGTWNGGVARLSLASGKSRVFRAGRESLVPGTVRCVEIAPSRVWVGTYQGLFAYSKMSDRWQEVAAFGGPEPQKVEALRLVRGRLYVGTLGGGLWRQEGEGWSRLSGGALPGDYITCLEAEGGELAIGTLTQGVVLLDMAGSSFRSFDRVAPGLEARNITMLLAEPGEALWIGTYGMGVYRWEQGSNRLEHFTRTGGQLADDWVLCAAATRSGIYFGTLGGGLSRRSARTGSWEVLGFRQGVPSPDVPAMAYEAPYLYLGSLGSGVTVLHERAPE